MLKKLLLPAIILIFSAGLIFYQFPDLPKNLSYDEVQFAKLALSLDGKPYTPYSQQATGHSTLYFYIILLSFKIFGITNFALRFPAALFGVLNPLIFYYLLKLVFRKSLTTNYLLLTTIAFTTSHWYFNFARFSFEATFLLFLELVSIYFILKSAAGEKSVSRILLILAGIFAGLAYNSYTPGRIFFLLPLTFLVYSTMKQYNNLTIKRILYFIIPFIIIITPLMLYLLRHPDPRVDQQFFLKNTGLSIRQKGEYLAGNFASTALMFNIKGDVNGRHNYPYKPALNPILGILFIAGLYLSIKNIKKFNNQIFLLYFFLSLLPAILTYPWENPNMLRTFTVIPSVIYFIGVAIYEYLTIVGKSSILKKKAALFCMVFIILTSCVYEIRTYFVYQAKVFPEAFEIKLPLPKAVVKF